MDLEIINPKDHDSIDTNFAPAVIKADGTLEGLWRTWQDCPAGQDATQCSVIHTVTSGDWKTPSKYSFKKTNVFGAGQFGRDPIVNSAERSKG